MIGIILMVTAMTMTVWVRFRLRSYVMQSGQGPVGPDGWTDWHLSREHAAAQGDSRGAALGRWFVFWQVALAVGLVLALCGV